MPMPQGRAWVGIKNRIAPPDKRIIKEHRDDFWRYIDERYRIFIKKEVNEDPFPWTEDKILRDNHFTNVYRRDDKGTRWLLENIGRREGRLTPSRRSVLTWRTLQYRLPNYHTLFEEYGWIPRAFKRRRWLKRIERTKEKHGKWHTSAHIVLQSNFKQSRAMNYMDYLGELDENFDEFFIQLMDAGDMKSAFKAVKRMKGFGGFTAYEVCIDLCYLGVLPDNFRDQYAHPGPGAKEGIDLIFPDRRRLSYDEAMARLRKEQRSAFQRLKLDSLPEELTLQDIEFSLCEFSKYIKTRHGTGRNRKYRVKVA